MGSPYSPLLWDRIIQMGNYERVETNYSKEFEFSPVVWVSQSSWCLLLSQTLLHLPLSVSRLPLTCWHLLGASLSHSAGSSYSSPSLTDGIGRMIFFLLRLYLWQRLNAGASAGMLQRFCRARDNPPPSHHHPRIVFLLLIIIFSLEWCHSLGETQSSPRWPCKCALRWPTEATEHWSRGQTATSSRSPVRSDRWSKSFTFQSRLNLNYTFPMWRRRSSCTLASLPLLCLHGLSQHALTSSLLGKLQSVSAICSRAPRRQITTLSGAARSNALTLKVSSLWLFQVNKPLQPEMFRHM